MCNFRDEIAFLSSIPPCVFKVTHAKLLPRLSAEFHGRPHWLQGRRAAQVFCFIFFPQKSVKFLLIHTLLSRAEMLRGLNSLGSQVPTTVPMATATQVCEEQAHPLNAREGGPSTAPYKCVILHGSQSLTQIATDLYFTKIVNHCVLLFLSKACHYLEL